MIMPRWRDRHFVMKVKNQAHVMSNADDDMPKRHNSFTYLRVEKVHN